MSDLFVGSFTSFLASSPPDGHRSDGMHPDVDGVFDFVENEYEPDASQAGVMLGHTPRDQSGYETPTPSDGGWLASQGMRPAMTVVSSDDEQEDPVAELDAGDSDDEGADELGDAGVAQEAASEWKIDHSSGDHRLHGMACTRLRRGPADIA
jgi:hypothetical protein